MLSPSPRPVFALLIVLLANQPRLGHAQWITNGAVVCNAANHQTNPQAVSDGAGGVIVAWVDSRNGNLDVYAQHVLASGVADPTWTPNGVLLCGAANNQDFVRIVADGSGGAIVSWSDDRSSVTRTDIYAQRVLASGVVDPAWTPNGTLLCDALWWQYYPQIVTDGEGGAIVAWQDSRAGNDIYAQRVLASGVVDPAWTPNGVLLSNAADSQLSPTIAEDGAGGAIVAWYDFRHNGVSGTDIYAQRVLASGVVDLAWTTNGVLVCDAANAQAFPTIVGDGSGGAIVTWYDKRSTTTDNDIYAQRVLASGTVDPDWPPNGTLLCDAVGQQLEPKLVEDGAGGAIVTWYDFRDGTTSADIYAQRVFGSGVVDPSWPADGTLLCAAPGNQLRPVIAADGMGGAFVAWDDVRSGAEDIYAHHVLASGVVDPTWPTHGALLCNASGIQVAPTIAADGTGGAIVSWFDNRSGTTNYDIYIQRVYAGGAVAAVAGESRPQISFHAPHPNPARVGATISFDLAATQSVSVGVYDVSGHLVRALIADQRTGAGPHNLVWDGLTDAGERVSAGLYFIRVTAGQASTARKIAILP